MHAIRRYPMRTLNQGITSIREAAVEDFVSIRKFFAKSDSRTGHFMRTLGSQPLPMQTCPKQVRAQVSSHALPGRSHCFLLALHATDLRSLDTRHAARTPLRNNPIVLQHAFLRFNAHSAGAIVAV